MYCIHCGKQIDDGDKFCVFCGKSTGEAPIAPVVSVAAGESAATGEPASTSVLQVSSAPVTPPVMPVYNPQGFAQYNNPPDSKKSPTLLIAVAVFLLFVIIGLVIGILLVNKKNSKTDDTTTPSIYDSTENADNIDSGSITEDFAVDSSDSSDSSDPKTAASIVEEQIEEFSVDKEYLEAIITAYSTTNNVSVAIIDLDTGKEFKVGSSSEKFVASGFYAPIYLLAKDLDSTLANTMMSKQDNDSANKLIEKFGGLSKVNSALDDLGLSHTTYGRKFGDTKASNAGKENYTSPSDAVKVLKMMYENGGYKKMQVNLSDEGISAPTGVTYYANRGQGIGGAYNIFVIFETTDYNYAVAIFTKHEGKTAAEAKADAAPMISELLSAIKP
ncbi:MAG: serine hydrolase [Lachnospiraceae bacterium]|jgi:hypothetical protein|nr:serine hydrolase [Lachnospiraceae bacterium]